MLFAFAFGFTLVLWLLIIGFWLFWRLAFGPWLLAFWLLALASLWLLAFGFGFTWLLALSYGWRTLHPPPAFFFNRLPLLPTMLLFFHEHHRLFRFIVSLVISIGICADVLLSWYALRGEVLRPLFLFKLNTYQVLCMSIEHLYMRLLQGSRGIWSNPVDATLTGNTPRVKGCEAVLGRRSS